MYDVKEIRMKNKVIGRSSPIVLSQKKGGRGGTNKELAASREARGR